MATIPSTDKILVSGATGSLGREIIRCLAAEGLTPVALVRPESDTGELEYLGIERRVADLRNQQALQAAFQGITLGIHAAAWISFRQDRMTQFTGINTFGAIDFYKAARAAGARRVVTISTVAAIGASRRKPGGNHFPQAITEDHEFNLGHLHIPYILSKRAAEHELLALAADGAPELILLNPVPILTDHPPGGLKGRIDKQLRRMVLPRFDNLLSLVDVRDCAPAVVAALSQGEAGRRYILAGETIPFSELLRQMGKLLGRDPWQVRLPLGLLLLIARLAAGWARLRGASEIAFYPDLVRLTEYDWGYSADRAKAELGFAPRPLAETLADLLGDGFGTVTRDRKGN
jgi:dihydroflavonol-4-reductase